jgi:hypothetical protein
VGWKRKVPSFILKAPSTSNYFHEGKEKNKKPLDDYI